MFPEPSAMGLKTGDDYAVPLCPRHHADLHHYGDERTWWALAGIDPLEWRSIWLEEYDRAKTLPKGGHKRSLV